jgi:hypothetical protein
MTDTAAQRMDEALMFTQNVLDERIDKLRQKYPFFDRVMTEEENIIKASEEKYKNHTLDELLAVDMSGLEKAEKSMISNYFELKTAFLSCAELLELVEKAVDPEFRKHIKEFVRQKQGCLAKKFRAEE